MVIECAFWRLKAKHGCLRKDMDINLHDLPYVIQKCFILHNSVKSIRSKLMNKGGDVVIVAVRDYIKEAERQLNNTKNYRKLQEHTTALNMNLAK